MIQTFGACVCAFTLTLTGLSAGGEAAASAQRTAAAGSRPCSLVQKTPLFVAFAPGMVLDDFEPAAHASRDILRRLKATLCRGLAQRDNAALVTPSLQAALAARRPVQSRELRFDDRNFTRAHVVLAGLSLSNARTVAWHAHFERRDTDWSLARTSEEHIAVAATP
jgi:hypothetical protein